MFDRLARAQQTLIHEKIHSKIICDQPICTEILWEPGFSLPASFKGIEP